MNILESLLHQFIDSCMLLSNRSCRVTEKKSCNAGRERETESQATKYTVSKGRRNKMGHFRENTYMYRSKKADTQFYFGITSVIQHRF